MEHDTLEEAEIDRLDDEPAAAPSTKNGKKKAEKAPKAPPALCRGCGQTSDGRALCWNCRETHKTLVAKLVVEAFAQGHQMKEGVALAFDWAEAVLQEGAAREAAGAALRGGS